MQPSEPGGSALTPQGPRAPVPTRATGDRERRWRLVRDLAVFQAKLVVDGLKDLVLAPVSLVAALVGLVLDRDDPGRSFYTLMRWGHGFDRWVNLFGTARRALPAAPNTDPDPHREAGAASPAHDGLDAYVARVERALAEQVRRGGLTAKAKDAIDQALDGLAARKPPS